MTTLTSSTAGDANNIENNGTENGDTIAEESTSIRDANQTVPPTPESGEADALPMDWTKLGKSADDIVIRYPADVYEIDVNDSEICIVGTAGQKITHMGCNFSETVNPNLESLILRSHVIRKIDGLQQFTSLRLLELYDNQVESLANCLDCNAAGCPGKTLRVLDMSYNSIRDMDPVAQCPNLEELYLANNKIKAMAGLRGLSQLKKIDLGANRIRDMDVDELSGLINLEELWLGKNKIELIQGIDALTKLRRLDVQSNRLTTVENLVSQRETLEELYLSHNAITSEGASLSTGLAQEFTSLTVLDLCRNQLTTCQPFRHLTTLEELWLSGNKIEEFDAVEPLAQLVQLETVYLEYNPLQSDPLYRKKLAQLIPSLQQIDANQISGYETRAAAHYQVPNNNNPRAMGTNEEALRRLQEMAVARAQDETQQGDATTTTSS